MARLLTVVLILAVVACVFAAPDPKRRRTKWSSKASNGSIGVGHVGGGMFGAGSFSIGHGGKSGDKGDGGHGGNSGTNTYGGTGGDTGHTSYA